MRDFLTDLVQELENNLGYKGIRLVHSGGGVSLDDLGTAGFEHFAAITESIVLDEPVEWRMYSHYPEPTTVHLGIKVSDSTEMADVTFEHGGKGNELRVDEVLGQIKEGYL